MVRSVTPLKKKYWLVLVAVAFLFVVNFAKADTIITEDEFALQFLAGESFAVQDLNQSATLTFTVFSGSLNGSGSLTTTDAGGIIIITPTTVGTMIVTANTTEVMIQVNGANYAGLFAYATGQPFTVSWTWGSLPPVTVITSGNNNTLYFRSDTQTVNTVTGFRLEKTNSETTDTISSSSSGSVTVYYGFRVWIAQNDGTETELTAGTPEGVITLTGTVAGFQESFWLAPLTSLSLGFDALKVNIYVRFGAGSWTAKATYISSPLMSKQLLTQSWRFRLYATRAVASNTTTSFSFGSLTRASRITGVGLKVPLTQEIQNYYLMAGDFLNWLFYGYTSLLGQGIFLGILLLIGCSTTYVRYRSFIPVLIIFILFGGTGGLVWALVPAPASFLVWVFLLLGLSALLFRVIR